MQNYWVILSIFRLEGALFAVLYRSKAAKKILMSDAADEIADTDIKAWVPEIQKIYAHLQQEFNAINTDNIANSSAERSAAVHEALCWPPNLVSKLNTVRCSLFRV